MSLKAKLADIFIDGLVIRPEDFTETKHRLVDTKTKKEWWVSTAPFGIMLYEPYEEKLGMYHSFRCWSYLRAWRKANKESYRNKKDSYMRAVR